MLLDKEKVYYVNAVETRTITNISGVKYADETGDRIDCIVTFREFPLDPMPFTANKFDEMAHGREIYNDLKVGVFGDIAPYEPPVTPEE